MIGTGALKILDRENGIGEVKRLSVLPEQQGNGYGKMLLGKIIVEAKQRDLNTAIGYNEKLPEGLQSIFEHGFL